MFERFTKAAREVVVQAHEEGQALGARTIEAEHLLLAVSGCPAVAAAMEAAGAGHDALVEALELEMATALETVGVSVSSYGSPAAVRTRGKLRFGTSAKRILEQAVTTAARDDSRQLEARHLLTALLLTDRGTVPRTLEAAGVDRYALLRDVRTAPR